MGYEDGKHCTDCAIISQALNRLSFLQNTQKNILPTGAILSD